jgi:hypothetical protein
MKVGDLVRCTWQGRNAICIIIENASNRRSKDKEPVWWKILYPDGGVLTVHRTYIREIR